MKKSLLLTLLVLIFVGCTTTPISEPKIPAINITSATTIDVDPFGESKTINYTIENPIEGQTLTAVAQDVWITDIKSWVDGSIEYTVIQNDTESSRETQITLSYQGAKSEIIVVKQKPATLDPESPRIIVEQSEINAESIESTKQVNYSVKNSIDGESIKLESSENWINNLNIKTSGVIEFQINQNDLYVSRTAIITINYKDAEPATITITQDARPKNPLRLIVANEGQFGYGTASITGLDDNGFYKQDLFRMANGRTLGDVAQSVTQIDNNLFVTLNNSRKVEIFDAVSFKSVATILTPEGSIPTYMCHLGADSMAVTEKGSQGRLVIMDIKRYNSRRVIEKVGSSNQMLLTEGKLFIAGSTLRVFTLGSIDTENMRTINDNEGKAISVVGDSKIVKDKNGMIWVLTSKALVCIDPVSESVVKKLSFTGISVGMWDGRLDIAPDLGTLYFFASANSKKSIFAVAIDASEVSATPAFTVDEVRTSYNMAVSKEGTIFVCDVQFGSLARGLVHEFNTSGEKLQTFEAGIFPQYIHFF